MMRVSWRWLLLKRFTSCQKGGLIIYDLLSPFFYAFSLSASAFPPAAVCLVIAGLKPRDGDTAWGNVTLNVSSVLHARKGEEAICRAR